MSGANLEGVDAILEAMKNSDISFRVPEVGAYKQFKKAPKDLQPLSEINDDWKISDDSPDPRGSLIVDSGGRELGVVQDVLVSRSNEQAFFAVVKVNERPVDQNYLLPISALHKVEGVKNKQAYGPYRREDFEEVPVWTVENHAVGYKSFEHWSKVGVR